MPAQMVLHEGRDEIVRVVVALLHPEGERDAGVAAGGFEQFRSQLSFEEAVGSALIDEDFRKAGAILDERDGVRRAPGAAVGAEVAAEGFLAPGDLRGCDDGGESGYAAVTAGIAKGEGEGTVAAHRMAGDRLAGRIDREIRFKQLRKFGRQVAEHAV